MSQPRRVGGYELLELLGSGGMGSVYRARRTGSDFESEVAVKLLQRGAPSADRLPRSASFAPEAARRFARERQILAELGHPGIAHLIDGGTAEDGTPFLVMELIDGRPIDVYCRQEALALQARLDLFVQVCAAVRHAHARLVVHTDLKPSNVLVDDQGHVHLLDFGIAKLVDDPASDGSTTWTLLRPMTPAYASPEQVRGEPVATSTDQYSLGVLLYELLTGSAPYPPQARSGRALEEAILDHEPAPPSSVVDGSETPAATSRGIDGDLDTIVLKALHKDPDRRYASVEQLADDIGRYRAGLPIRARPDTLGYRTGKFVRRNRAAVAGSAVTLASILAFGVVSIVLGEQLERERDAAAGATQRAEVVTDFLVDVFDAPDANRAQGGILTARAILGSGGARVRSELAGQPATQGAVASAIGEAYLRLAGYDSAVAHFHYARERLREAHGADSHEYASSLNRLGRARSSAGDLDEAEALFGEALERFRSLTGPESLEVATSLVNVAGVQAARTQQEAAERSYLEALAIRRARLPEGDEAIALTLNNLGVLYREMGRPDDAITTLGEAVDARRSQYGDRPHTSLAASLNNLAGALEEAGQFAEAEPLYVESLEMRTALVEPEHPSVLALRNNLAGLAIRTGRPERAAIEYAEIVAIMRSSGPPPMRLAQALSNHGMALVRTGRIEEALPSLRECEAIIAREMGPDHVLLAFPRQSLGDAYAGLGRSRDAERLYRAALAVREEGLPADHPSVAFSMNKLGGFLLDEGRTEEAAPLLEGAKRVRDEVFAADHPDRIDSLIKVGRLRMAQDRREEGMALIAEAAETAEAARGPDDGQARTARGLVGGSG
jgi:eukaryotic-like serine/threonine-protein kinase